MLRTPNGTRLRSINRTWENIRAAAGLHDVRLHDLRHSFASDALMSGVPLAVVGEDDPALRAPGEPRRPPSARGGHEPRIVAAVTPLAALAPPRFEPMHDAQWKAIAAIVESTRGRCGGPRTDLRRTVDAIRGVLQTGAKWRELPAEYGTATTSWRWYERWCGDGTWQQIAAALELPPTELGREPGHRPPRTKTRRSAAPIDAEATPLALP